MKFRLTEQSGSSTGHTLLVPFPGLWLSAGKRWRTLQGMLNGHDRDVLPRCRRLGHEVAFSYCRQETGGKPCRLILDCWWEQFDVRAFLQANLPAEVMAQVERASNSPPPARVVSLLDLIEQARERLGLEQPESGSRQQGKP